MCFDYLSQDIYKQWASVIKYGCETKSASGFLLFTDKQIKSFTFLTFEPAKNRDVLYYQCDAK